MYIDKPSSTIKPDKPVTPRVGIDTPLKQVSGKKVRGITIELGLGDKSKLKLRAIAKHAGALVDELDRIDNVQSCDCGVQRKPLRINNKQYLMQCSDCGSVDGVVYVNEDELPTRLEGSD